MQVALECAGAAKPRSDVGWLGNANSFLTWRVVRVVLGHDIYSAKTSDQAITRNPSPQQVRGKDGVPGFLCSQPHQKTDYEQCPEPSAVQFFFLFSYVVFQGLLRWIIYIMTHQPMSSHPNGNHSNIRQIGVFQAYFQLETRSIEFTSSMFPLWSDRF